MVEEQIKGFISKLVQYISSYEQFVMVERNRECVDGKIIGTGRADYTQGANCYDLSIGQKTFSLIDIPGIEGDESRFEDIIRDSLDKAHTIFYVNGSGKKLEQATLEKVKKYMHDGTSVYAVFNVHCKAKKERIPGIDRSFEDELNTAYVKQQEIVDQTEKELSSFLGNNYMGSLTLNGLLSFCGYAIDDTGRTTIVDEKDKNLRADQKKYINEYKGEIERLRNDSHIGLVQDIINDKVSHFESDIYSENIKKLKNRLHEMIVRIDDFKSVEICKITGFIRIYNEFESNCYNAKEDFIHTIRQIGYNSAADAFADVKSELFMMVEKDKGKTDGKKVQEYFDSHKDRIIKELQTSLNNRIKQAQIDYEEAIEEARRRLLMDSEREQTKFQISLAAGHIKLDGSFVKALKYNIESFRKDLLRIGSLALGGFYLGSAVPAIGNIIGVLAGIVIGIFSSIWSFFASKDNRINKAKEQLQRAIDDQIDEVADNIEMELKKLDLEEKINASYEQIYKQAEKQKESLEFVKRLLNNISTDLKKNYRKVS